VDVLHPTGVTGQCRYGPPVAARLCYSLVRRADTTGVPADTLYHRWLGWHAPAMRRAVTVFTAGVIVAVVLLPFVTWGLALAVGWDAAAVAYLLATWPIIIRADSARAAQLAAREDQTEGSARALLVGARAAPPELLCRPARPAAAGAARPNRRAWTGDAAVMVNRAYHAK